MKYGDEEYKTALFETVEVIGYLFGMVFVMGILQLILAG